MENSGSEVRCRCESFGLFGCDGLEVLELDKVEKGKVLKLEDCKNLGTLELPPMMEEITIDPETQAVYTQFESASSPYADVEGNPCKSIVDRVCVSSLEDWFPEV